MALHGIPTKKPSPAEFDLIWNRTMELFRICYCGKRRR